MAALDKTRKEAQRLIQILAKQDRGGCGLPPPHGALRNGLASAHKYFRNFCLTRWPIFGKTVAAGKTPTPKSNKTPWKQRKDPNHETINKT